MEIIHRKFKSDSLDGDWIITIGNFDGYHLGHQALVDQVLTEKKATDAKGGILTFDPHPKKVLQPQNPFRHIYDDTTKWNFMEASGLDACFVIPFSLEFAKMSSMEFLEGLFEFVSLRKIIIGYDFNFGRDREGSSTLLREEAHKRNIDLLKLDAYKIGEITVSSTMIRRLLFEGDFESVEKFLGRPWSVNGTVKEGNKLGHTLGFPTLNLEPDVLLPLKKGVFICKVELDNQLYNGVCNVGVNPTFGGKTLKVESHLFDFNENAYGRQIKVYPRKFLREEMKFESVDDLKKKIHLDVETALQLLKQESG
jgi:riboflavin kinase / FMN adenylyltransferase